MLERHDADGDGVLSDAEREAARQGRHERMGEFGGGHRRGGRMGSRGGSP